MILTERETLNCFVYVGNILTSSQGEPREDPPPTFIPDDHNAGILRLQCRTKINNYLGVS